jgi:hypothetical protein
MCLGCGGGGAVCLYTTIWEEDVIIDTVLPKQDRRAVRFVYDDGEAPAPFERLFFISHYNTHPTLITKEDVSELAEWCAKVLAGNTPS